MAVLKSSRPLDGWIALAAMITALGLYPVALYAQETTETVDQRRPILTGRVTDAETGDPLPAVNLFCAHTTRGTTTDSTGTYRLVLPPGSYELVASMVGYERGTTSLEVSGGEEQIIRDFELEPTVIETEEVQVSAPENTVWRDRFEQFREQFLGGSQNTRQTEIENPYPLEFEVNPLGTLIATSPRPLTIVNRALGYRITFHLGEFRWNERFGSGQYSGDPFFENLTPANEQEANRWVENRAQTYRGSLRHFLRAVMAGRSRDEGFYVKRDTRAQQVRRSENAEIPAGLKVASPRDNRPLWFRAIDADTLIGPTDQPHLYELSFTGTLRVIYVGSPEDAQLTFWRQRSSDGSLRVSWLHLEEPAAHVHEQGYLYNPGALIRTGAMSKRRMADMLPYEYTPDK